MSPQEVAIERIERAKVYFEAVSPYDIRDIEAAAQSFITGSAPGHNPAFVPSAPQVGAEVRRLMTLRTNREDRDRRLRPALPPPDIEHSPESRARVKAMIEELSSKVAGENAPDEAETERHNAIWAKTNARFFPDMSDEAVHERLGFTVGDPDAEGDMGEEAA